MSEPVELPQMPAPAEQSWLGLLDVADAVPDHWALVGGQLVHLHCWERGVPPLRVTRDSDVVLDVRAWPQAAEEFTSTLRRLGFAPAGTTWNDRQYRWVRDQAQIDVLIARFLGERAQDRVGVDGRPQRSLGDGPHQAREPAAGLGDHQPAWTASARSGCPGCAGGTGTPGAGHEVVPPAMPGSGHRLLEIHLVRGWRPSE